MKRFLLLFLSCSSLYAQVIESTLGNGLKLLVKPDHRAPIAIVMVWYKVGSADEIGGLTGLSHALEHMMFKGTRILHAGDFSQIIAAHGGQDNAFTNQDYTAYFEKINKRSLNTALRLEADRMQNLLLSEEEFGKEINVIREERRLRIDDNPQSLALERFMATAYLASAYQHPVIGWMSDLMHMQRAELKKWYQQYYAPNNATLVIIGDVDPQKVRAKVEHYFGAIPKHNIPQRYVQTAPEALGKKQVAVNVPAQQPILLLGYTVPTLGYLNWQKRTSTTEAYTLEVIAGLLDAGDNGRLTKSLINTQHLAATANAYYDLYTRYQTQFMLFGMPTQTHSVEELKQGFIKEIHQLQTTPVDAYELKRIQTQLIAQNTFAQDSLFGQAMKIGLVETIGLSHTVIEAYNDQIRAVTPEQIMACAKKYFCDDCITETTLSPQSVHKGSDS